MPPRPLRCNAGLLSKVGTYNREFAKRRVKGLDKALGKHGELLDLPKAKKALAEGGADRLSASLNKASTTVLCS